jgi:anaerobic dimethyl sulfoxide reductase subunit A
MKAKEAGIPITVVDTRYTDTAASMATGSGDVPPLICVRPGTDGALLAAMANIIFRKGLHDEVFLREYCFGFFPEDRVTSSSKRKNPVTAEPFAGKSFTVPTGCSFVEYLDQLEKEHGGYEGVLRWASMLTGTPAEVIEKFGLKYGLAKPAFIFSSCNGGAQRTENGMYFSWMMIALSAMAGYINKRGGGFGEIRFDDGYSVKLAPPPPLASARANDAILFSMFRSDDVILHGRDGRTPEQLREDVLIMNGIDLGPEARLWLEMVVRGAARVNPFNQSQNINKRIIAWKKLKYAVSYERFMTATAAWSDIVLPSITDFEQSCFARRFVSDTFVVNGPIEHMYEAKPDWWINEQIAGRLGLDFGRKGLTDLEIMKQQWRTASIPDLYREVQPAAKLPSFKEILDTADFQLPVPPEKSVIHAASVKPGEFKTETGLINFYSPFLAERKRAVLNVSKAQYVRAPEGYEEILEDGGKMGQKGVKYTLQFITPHVSQRAHTIFDNVPILKDQCPHVVQMHPVDAAARGIIDGEVVYVFNDVGCIKLPVSITRRIIPGVVAIGQGVWYRPSTSETYEAWFDIDGDGKPEKHVVPVDVGGCVNTITKDVNSGVLDPFSPDSMGMNAGGALCEITKTKPQ